MGYKIGTPETTWASMDGLGDLPAGADGTPVLNITQVPKAFQAAVIASLKADADGKLTGHYANLFGAKLLLADNAIVSKHLAAGSISTSSLSTGVKNYIEAQATGGVDLTPIQAEIVTAQADATNALNTAIAAQTASAAVTTDVVTAQDKADEAFAKAVASRGQAEFALTTANTAASDASNAKTAVEAATTAAATATTDAATALTKANSVESSANSAVTTAVGAEAKADEAFTNAAAAKARADIGVANAGTAQGVADNAKALADTLDTTALKSTDSVATQISKLANDVVTRDKIKAAAVGYTEIAHGAITTDHMTAGTIDGNVITAGTISADTIAVPGGTLINGSGIMAPSIKVESANIGTAQIDTLHLANNSVAKRSSHVYVNQYTGALGDPFATPPVDADGEYIGQHSNGNNDAGLLIYDAPFVGGNWSGIDMSITCTVKGRFESVQETRRKVRNAITGASIPEHVYSGSNQGDITLALSCHKFVIGTGWVYIGAVPVSSISRPTHPAALGRAARIPPWNSLRITGSIDLVNVLMYGRMEYNPPHSVASTTVATSDADTGKVKHIHMRPVIIGTRHVASIISSVTHYQR